MSFSTKTDKLLKDLVQAEYGNACDNWGSTYNSLHEGYAILLEEIQEAEEEMNKIKRDLDSVWFSIKRNDIEIINMYLERIQESSLSCIAELAQVSAVMLKIKNTIVEAKVNGGL